MENIKLTMALSHYDRHVPLFDGSVTAEGIDLEVLFVGQSSPGRHGEGRHERMLPAGEFDICELSLSSYLMARSRKWPFTAVPVFPRRLFSQSQIYVNAAAGIRAPQDLIGRKVGLNTFQTTLSVLAKGDLQWEYDTPWRRIRWFVSRPETVDFRPMEGTRVERIPEGKKIGAMLVEGEIDALMVPHPPRVVQEAGDRVTRLFPDCKAEELNYFRKNGWFPIMHVVAFKDEVLEKHPWAAASVMAAFEKAKQECYRYYSDPNWSVLAWGRHFYEEERRLLGEDPWPNGLRKNRANLERFIEYSHDQGLIDRKVPVEELFFKETLNT